MITIHHFPGTRSLRIVWLMEELGEAYRLEKVTMPTGPEVARLNPVGSIPVIEDDGIVMGESLAILQYLTGRRLVAGDEAAKALTVGPLPDPAHYAEHLQYLHYGEAALNAPLSVLFRARMAGEGESAVAQDQLGQFSRRLKLLETALADGRRWVTGDQFTIADISIGTALGLAQYLDLSDLLSTDVKAYCARLFAREAYQRAAAA